MCGRGKIYRTGFAAVLASGLMLTAPAFAQVALYDAGEYGNVELSFNESTGDAAAFIAAQNGAFEPVHELPEYDPIRKRARAIGRVDLLVEGADGKRSMGTCTGAVLAGGWVLTNHHCIPAKASGQRLLKASIVLDYLTADGKGARRFKLSTAPEDWHSGLDFSLVRALDVPGPEYGVVTFTGAKVRAGEPLLVIHHPLGRPKVMTRFRCFAAAEQPGGSILRHRCDTMPGSSGSLLFNRSLEPVVLHHSGGMQPQDVKSYNQGTRIRSILEASKLLAAAPAQAAAGGGDGAAAKDANQAAPPAKTTAGSGGLGVGEINTLLKGD